MNTSSAPAPRSHLVQVDNPDRMPKPPVQSSKSDLRIARSLLHIGRVAWLTNSLPSAERFLEHAHLLLKREGRDEGGGERSEVCRELGDLWLDCRRDCARAREMYDLALRHGQQSVNPGRIAAAMTALARLHHTTGALPQALDLLEECLNICASASLLRERGKALGLLGTLYHASGERGRGEELLRRSLCICSAVRDDAGKGRTLRALGEVRLVQKKFSEALRCCRRAVRLFNRVEDPFQIGLTLIHIGVIYSESGRHGKAYEYLDRVLAIGGLSENPAARGIALLEKGGVLSRERRWEEGRIVTEEALELIRQGQLPAYERCACKQLFRIHEALGSVAEAVAYHRRGSELDQQLSGIAIQRKLAGFFLRHRIQETRRERDAHRAEVQKARREVEKREEENSRLSRCVEEGSVTLNRLREELLDLRMRNGEERTEVGQLIVEMEREGHREDPGEVLEASLERTDSRFEHALANSFPDLTPAELRLCSLMRRKLPNREIAALLNVSTRTLDGHRRNIRRKLGLKRGEDLVERLLKFR